MRLIRIASKQVVMGWVHYLDESLMQVRIPTELVPEPGENMIAEIFGKSLKAQVQMAFSNQVDGLEKSEGDKVLEFRVISSFKYSSATENFRARVPGLEAILSLSNGCFTGTMLDAGPKEIGVKLHQKVSSDESIHVQISTPSGIIAHQGSIRNSTPLSEGYLTTISLTPESRLDAAKWDNYIRQVA